VREVVEHEHILARERLSRADEHNRKFFEKAAAQVKANAESRKLLKMVPTATALQSICDQFELHNLCSGAQFGA
jgi:hypothetical protein